MSDIWQKYDGLWFLLFYLLLSAVAAWEITQ